MIQGTNMSNSGADNTLGLSETDAINARSDVLGERELDAVSGGTVLLEMISTVLKGIAGSTGGGAPVDGPTQLFQQTVQEVAKGTG